MELNKERTIQEEIIEGNDYVGINEGKDYFGRKVRKGLSWKEIRKVSSKKLQKESRKCLARNEMTIQKGILEENDYLGGRDYGRKTLLKKELLKERTLQE